MADTSFDTWASALNARAAAARARGDDTEQRLADALNAHYSQVAGDAFDKGIPGDELDSPPLT